MAAHGTFRFYDSEIERLRGEALLQKAKTNEDEATACFAGALAVARQQSCRALELRAVTSLARLHLRQNRHRQARALLEPVYASFAEGFDTADMKAAEVLLAQLS